MKGLHQSTSHDSEKILSWASVPTKESPVTGRSVGTWQDIAKLVTTHTVRENKLAGPGWLPADIQPGPRTKNRVSTWCVLVLDIEGPTEKLSDGLKRLIGEPAPELHVAAAEVKARGWAGALATSHSHEAPGADAGHTLGPRYRIVLPVSRPVLSAEITPLGLHVAALLGLAECLDKTALDPSRLFFMPSYPETRKGLAVRAIVEGVPLDVDDLMQHVKVADAAPTRRVFREKASNGTVIDLFNEQADIGHIIEQAGYKNAGRNRWAWSGSTSGAPGVVLLPDSGRLYSHHERDPLFCEEHSHDAFGVWCILNHGGQVAAAVKAAAGMAGICEILRAENFNATEAYRTQIQQAPDLRALIDSICPGIASDKRIDGPSRGLLAKAVQEQAKRQGRSYSMPDCHALVALRTDGPPAPDTHHGYAQGLLAELTAQAGGEVPVGVGGVLYVVAATGVYEPLTVEALASRVAALYDGLDLCRRTPDYRAVAQHAYGLKEDPTFFDSAPVGLATAGGFYKLVSGGSITCEPLRAEHRQRHVHSVAPLDAPMPEFKRFMAESFKSIVPGDEDAQTELMQEISGAVALGLLAKHQKVVLLFGPGRSGKGTMTHILEALVPRASHGSVSPFQWDDEYYRACLAGKRLNIVGELPDDKPIPAAEFKTVTGLDLLSGRQPGGRVFQFRNEAAHVFSSNHHINTRDHSEAFYTRWLVVGFPNSRIDRAVLDTGLADRIVRNELPAILAWALAGAQRLVERGSFKTTAVHRAHMATWQRRTNSVMEFLHDTDVCLLDEFSLEPVDEYTTRRATLYEAYRRWCPGVGRQAVMVSKFNDALASPAGALLGLEVQRTAEARGLVRGVKLVQSWGFA